MRKKIVLIGLVLLFAGMTSAEEFTVTHSGSGDISEGSKIVVEYNISESSDYELSIQDSDDDVVMSGAPMVLVESYNDTANASSESTNETNVSSSSDDSYYVYQYNYTIPDDPQVGFWDAKVFDAFSVQNSTEFAVEPKRLRIVEARSRPDFKNSEDDVSFYAEVTNVDEGLDSLDVTVANTSIDSRSMNLQESGHFYQTYAYEAGRFPEGTYNYGINLRGSDGTTDSRSDEFYVYSSNVEADSADVSASISSLCGLEIQRFRAPGGGVLSLNGSGSFTVNFRNNGSAQANLSADLNVTYQNETQWLPEDGREELGPYLNLSYNRMNDSLLPGESSDTFVRQFNDTDDLGFYTGHLNMNATCTITDGAAQDPVVYGYQSFDLYDYTNFRVLVAGGGSGGKGNPTGDQAVPRDANQSGSESNQNVEGDNDNPGQTEVEVPVPEPEPVPEPVPEPDPTVNLNVEAWNVSASTDRGRFARIKLKVENIGGSPASDVVIRPDTSILPGEWSARPANIANLSVNETVNRSVFIQPSESVNPATYRLVMRARNSERLLDIEETLLTVNQEVFRSEIRISEAPQVVRIGANQGNQIPLLIQNIGEGVVNSTQVQVQNVESCGSISAEDVGVINVNESKSLTLNVNASDNIEDCNATVIVSTDDGSYSFSNMQIQVVADQGIVPPELRFPVFASAWTILLVIYSIVMTRYDLRSLSVRLPFILLIVGEAAIFIYISAEYYSLIPAFLLPF